ncbi:unnamed protein product [Strongylus vulgaris]|uniref:Reverse transcriptase domain-containing protein n=1 Tax=Strongylus vulgaris TaxID=40348 RepID=A0A3P7J6X9_STRVU|nr:unnamed protein product [Strongylus vulgaris]
MVSIRRDSTPISPSTPVSDPFIPTGEIPLRILPVKVRVAIQTMKAATALVPDHASADLSRAEGNRLHERLAEHLTGSIQLTTLADCYKKCSTTVLLLHRPLNTPILKGIRRGDTVSPKLFTASLLWVMRSLDWNESIRVDGRFLANLRFADDIALFSRNITGEEMMLEDLNEVGKRIVLQINRKNSFH